MKPRSLAWYLLAAGLLLVTSQAGAQSRAGYDFVYIGDPLPDPVMQQNKETFVLYGCAYCHGINLAPVGEAADLRTSALVAADVDANVIGPILRTGIPQTPKSSPMPQFSDLSEREIRAIAAYIHYARGEARYTDLMQAAPPAGDAALGRTYFEQTCASCHEAEGDMAGMGSRLDADGLRDAVLKPARFRSPPSYRLDERESTAVAAGRTEHQVWLENAAPQDVANIVAFLGSLR